MTGAFDHMVIGGGSAGSVATSRLVEDSGGKILLLEAGHHRRHPLLDMPPGVFKLLKNGSKFFTTHLSEPQPHLDGRRAEITPQILMLSSIGPEAERRAHGVDVVQRLDGVGQNLKGHPDVYVVARANWPYGYYRQGRG